MKILYVRTFVFFLNISLHAAYLSIESGISTLNMIINDAKLINESLDTYVQLHPEFNEMETFRRLKQSFQDIVRELDVNCNLEDEENLYNEFMLEALKDNLRSIQCVLEFRRLEDGDKANSSILFLQNRIINLLLLMESYFTTERND